MKKVLNLIIVFGLLVTGNIFLVASAADNNKIITFGDLTSQWTSNGLFPTVNDSITSIAVYNNDLINQKFNDKKEIDLIWEKLKTIQCKETPNDNIMNRIDNQSISNRISIKLNDTLQTELSICSNGKIYIDDIHNVPISSLPHVMAVAENPDEINNLITLLPVLGVEALHYDVSSLIESYIDENAQMSRGNCVTAIMKLIGVDKESANMYANLDYDKPMFYDMKYNNANTGYIILAKFSGVAQGVQTSGSNNIHNFETDRNVTVKECLAFILRCLKDPSTVKWGNIVFKAEKMGLLKSDEVKNLNDEETLTCDMFKTLLERMLNMKRYLYWSDEDLSKDYTKSIKIDETGSIRYIEWILEKENIE